MIYLMMTLIVPSWCYKQRWAPLKSKAHCTNLQCYTRDVDNNENVFYILAVFEAAPTKIDEANVDTSSSM